MKKYLTKENILTNIKGVIFIVILFFALSAISNNIKNNENEILVNDDFVYHGPHFGESLTDFLASQEEDLNVAATIKTQFRKKTMPDSIFNNTKNKSVDTSISDTKKLSTSSLTNINYTSTPTKADVIYVDADIKDNGYGIAAGGGLIGLNYKDLDNYFSTLKELGIKWVRWDIDWSVIQWKDSNTYDWVATDRVVEMAKDYGIKSLAIITYAPRWAGKSTCVAGKHCSPADPLVFGEFVNKVATRYKGKITAYEIWNEPNLTTFWSPLPNVADYSDNLKQAYIEIKKVDPTVMVISAGLSAAADVPGGSIAPITFVNGMYNAEANNYFDALGLHPYSYPVSPDYVAPWNSWQQMYKIRDVMISRGDNGKKIWITEYGVPTGGPGKMRNLDELTFNYGSDYMSELTEEYLVKRTAEIYSQNRSWLGGFFWYSLRNNGTDVSDPENFFGLVRNDWSKKNAFNTLKGILINMK